MLHFLVKEDLVKMLKLTELIMAELIIMETDKIIKEFASKFCYF